MAEARIIMFDHSTFDAGTFDSVSLPPPNIASLVLQGLVVPETRTNEGVLIKSVSVAWIEIARHLGGDWSLVMQLDPRQWEEIVAGAFQREGYEVVLTPRSGDHGRDLIATRSGIGAVRLLGSVKRYAAGHRVDAEACRSLLGYFPRTSALLRASLRQRRNLPLEFIQIPLLRRRYLIDWN